jgi:hypothetical protein
VPACCVRVMRCFLVVTALVMLGGFLVVTGGVSVMLWRLLVVIRCFFRHDVVLLRASNSLPVHRLGSYVPIVGWDQLMIAHEVPGAAHAAPTVRGDRNFVG